MRYRCRGSWACLAIVASFVGDCPRAFADEVRPILVSFDELQAIADSDQVDRYRILDARPRKDFEAGHVKGAIWADSDVATRVAAKAGGLADQQAWQAWLDPLKVGARSTVIVVDGGRQLDAARLWWLLRYLGVDDVKLVDGNFTLWKDQGRPTSTDSNHRSNTTRQVHFRTSWLASRRDVIEAIDHPEERIVDARSVEEWTGSKLLSKRGGHVPGACRLEWSQFVDEAGRFLPVENSRDMIRMAGIRPDQPIVSHCQGGGRASLDAFVFYRLGHPVRVYYASWGEYGNLDDSPIALDKPEASTTSPPRSQPVDDLPRTSNRPVRVEYYYKCRWGQADEFLRLFEANHLPILLERKKLGHFLDVVVEKPRYHAPEPGRWDYRVTIIFRDVADELNKSAEDAVKDRLYGLKDETSRAKYQAAENARFATLDAHWDVPIEPVEGPVEPPNGPLPVAQPR